MKVVLFSFYWTLTLWKQPHIIIVWSGCLFIYRLVDCLPLSAWILRGNIALIISLIVPKFELWMWYNLQVYNNLFYTKYIRLGSQVPFGYRVLYGTQCDAKKYICIHLSFALLRALFILKLHNGKPAFINKKIWQPQAS